MNKMQYEELVKHLNACSKTYYNGEPEIVSDKEWDEKFQELKNYEAENPEDTLSDSPTQKVGAPLPTSKTKRKVRHPIPLKSLGKSKNFEDIRNFTSTPDIVMQPKYDGNTCLLKYRDGKFYEASTRGNGTEGEDITHHAMQFNNIPRNVSDLEGEYWVVGEAIITRDAFESIKKDFPDYKNPRNLTSGFLHRDDTNLSSKISFFPFRVIKGMRHSNLSDELNFLSNLGFQVNYTFLTSENFTYENAQFYYNRVQDDYGIGCDGIVFTVDNYETAASMGETSHHPNHSIALKFEDEKTTTKVTEIRWQVGTTGELTPVAVFEPVELEGTTVTNASVHNLKIFSELDFGVGDIIEVFKANQIIPQVEKALTHTGDKQIPEVCPECGSTLVQERVRGVVQRLVCENEQCPAQFQKLCEKFVSRDRLNIDGLSGAGIEELIKAGLIKKLVDILKLQDIAVKRVSYFKGRRGDILLTALDKAKSSVNLERYIAAWGIPTIGNTVSKQLSQFCEGKVQNFIYLMDAKKSFTNLDGFGDVMQAELENWWSKNSDQFIEGTELCSGLSNLIKVDFVSEVPSKNLKVVITGTLEFGTRSKFAERLRSKGFEVQDSVKKDTDVLICGSKVGAGKTDKAKKLGVKVMTESEFYEEYPEVQE